MHLKIFKMRKFVIKTGRDGNYLKKNYGALYRLLSKKIFSILHMMRKRLKCLSCCGGSTSRTLEALLLVFVDLILQKSIKYNSNFLIIASS
jgi:hypothetical protein